MTHRPLRFVVTSLLLAGALLGCTPLHAQRDRDFLTELEADKIREAGEPKERIRLFVLFAEDRLKKFQYELSKGASDKRRAERMAALLDAFTGCVDDASELMDLGRTKQQDILKAVQLFQTKAREFQAELEKQNAAAPENAPYKENLGLALLAIEDGLKEAEKATKEIAPGPVRRKQ
jgi:hypothetical protein